METCDHFELTRNPGLAKISLRVLSSNRRSILAIKLTFNFSISDLCLEKIHRFFQNLSFVKFEYCMNASHLTSLPIQSPTTV